MRIHASRLTPDQKAHILQSLPRSGWQYTSYAAKRCQARSIPPACLRTTIERGHLIEVNDQGPAQALRLLVRAGGTCLVLQPATLEVITAYYNDPADPHQTLRRSEYHWGKIPAHIKAIWR